MSKKSNGFFDKFTNQYSLSKTLRFELRPERETLENMQKNMRWSKELQTFMADQEIEDAYQVLKPVFDRLHEDFITKSLESDEAKKLDVNGYFRLYEQWQSLKKKKAHEKDDEKKKNIEEQINKIYKEGKAEGDIQKNENQLRKIFEAAFEEYGKVFKEKANKIAIEDHGNEDSGDGVNSDMEKDEKKKGFRKLLKAKFLLSYIEKYLDEDQVFNSIKSKEGKVILKQQIEDALNIFKRFSTYFGGFDLNRSNYYLTKEEKATAVASRIVSENLPKFCDNVLEFYKKRNDYLKIYEFLDEKEIALKGKNQSGEEIDLEPIVENIFKIEYFKDCLSQPEIEKYNLQIGNANNLINRYNQQQGDDKSKRLRIFKTLYKQIGCGEEAEFMPVIKDDGELKEVLKKVFERGDKYFGKFDVKIDGKVDTVGKFYEWMKDNAWNDGVFWSDKALNIISGKYFANWFVLKNALKKEGVFTGKKKDDEDIKVPKAIPLKDLFEVLDKVVDWQDKGVLFKELLFDKDGNKKEIIEKATKPSEALLEMIFADVKKMSNDFSNFSRINLEKLDLKKQENIQIIKEFLDNLLFANQIVKYWKVKDKFAVDSDLVEALNLILFNKDNPTRDYDIVRNYLTRKPQDELNKLKLNFDSGTLLSGWSVGQEFKGQKLAVILKNNGKQYLGIINKNSDNKKLFDVENEENLIYQNITEGSGRLILMNLGFKTLAGKGFASMYNEKYGDMGKRNPQEAIEKLQEFIGNKYAEKYSSLKKIVDKKYEDKKVFDKDIQETLKECYVCEFRGINWKMVEKNIKSGDLYVFEIKCNQRVAQFAYWQSILAENSPHQLSGQGEVFYRPASTEIEKKPKVGYENKKDKTGKNYVIENKRFTEEKFFLHQATKINYKSPSYKEAKYYLSEMNAELNRLFIESKDTVHFIGIDRGEKHLIYVYVINQKGEKVFEKSLNTINGVDYNKLLSEKSEKRDDARKNWKTIGEIKDLKNGYISQAVHEIVDLVIKYNAYIVLENLNTGFKRGRQKIEKSVYQKLELALAKKLNFLVDKKAEDGEIMSVQKALQLTPPVNNFSEIEKASQFGIMLYTRANYTSQTDPITGWRKSIYLQKGSEDSIKTQITDKFTEIAFDGKDYCFKYKDGLGTEWELYSGKSGKGLDRYRGVRTKEQNIWKVEPFDVMQTLDGIFANFDKSRSLLSQIVDEGVELTKVTDLSTAWESLRFAIDLIQQIRNTGVDEKDSDFLQSPVRDEAGNHFDSREAVDGQPNSGDANGAYNIARKGIVMFDRIKDKPEKPDLFIKDADWDTWLVKN